MAYDEGLAFRIEEYLEQYDDVYPKKMFGGICWLIKGNIACGIFEESLISRVGPELYTDSLNVDGVKEFDLTGRPMKGWVIVTEDVITEDQELISWINKGLSFGRTLPAK